jgi:hypothetical protein
LGLFIANGQVVSNLPPMKFLIFVLTVSCLSTVFAAEKPAAPDPTAVDAITARRAADAADEYTEELAQAAALTPELEEELKAIQALLDEGRAAFNRTENDKASAAYLAVTQRLGKLSGQRQVLGKRYQDLQAESLAFGRLFLENSVETPEPAAGGEVQPEAEPAAK